MLLFTLKTCPLLLTHQKHIFNSVHSTHDFFFDWQEEHVDNFTYFYLVFVCACFILAVYCFSEIFVLLKCVLFVVISVVDILVYGIYN